MRNSSELQRSPNKFDFDVNKFVPNEEILMLSELPCLSKYVLRSRLFVNEKL